MIIIIYLLSIICLLQSVWIIFLKRLIRKQSKNIKINNRINSQSK
jgi:hypothetical protein